MIAVEVSGFGGTEVLNIDRRLQADLQVLRFAGHPGPVLIRIQACGLNWSDMLMRAGAYFRGPRPPYIAGQEAAGIVIAHGEGVASPPIGAEV